MGTFAWDSSVGYFHLFTWKPSPGSFRSIIVATDFSLGIVRLGTFAWERPLGIFRLGSFAWIISFVFFSVANFRSSLGIFACGNNSVKALGLEMSFGSWKPREIKLGLAVVGVREPWGDGLAVVFKD